MKLDDDISEEDMVKLSYDSIGGIDEWIVSCSEELIILMQPGEILSIELTGLSENGTVRLLCLARQLSESCPCMAQMVHLVHASELWPR